MKSMLDPVRREVLIRQKACLAQPGRKCNMQYKDDVINGKKETTPHMSRAKLYNIDNFVKF